MTPAHITRLITFAQHGQPTSYAASDMMRSDLEALLEQLVTVLPKIMERDAMRTKIAQLEAEVSQYRDLHGQAYAMVVRLQHERDELKIEEPAAFRHSFDGYGWLYCDDGSGSSWKEMVYPDKEFLFTRKMPTIEWLEADDTEGGAL